jgi:hypothetical protein
VVDPVIVSVRALRLITTPAMLRHARVTHRADPELYPDLLQLSVLLTAASGRKVAVQASNSDDEFMTVNEYSAAAGITPRAVRMACRDGRIRGVKRGRDWLIPVGELALRDAAC